MRTIEEIKEQLVKDGYLSKAQVETRTFLVMMSLISENKASLSDFDLPLEIERLKKEKKDLEKRNEFLKMEIRRLEDEYSEKSTSYESKRINKMINAFECYKESFEKCETTEERDTLRIAQFYVNNTEINTVYDNTAFISGLAYILSGKKFGDISKIEQIKAEDINMILEYYDPNKKKFRRIK